MERASQFHLLPTAWRGEGVQQFADEYRRAFAKAEQLYIVSAFLTEWPSALRLNPKCKEFRLIIGTDFGTTRRAAVESVLRWLPKRFLGEVRAFNLRGVNFHPKAVLWREASGRRYLLIGSSNLTRAAFESNVEANVTVGLSSEEYARTLTWFRRISDCSLEVNDAWLGKYVEAPIRSTQGGGKRKPATSDEARPPPVFDLALELTNKADRNLFARHLRARRAQRAYFDAHSKMPLLDLVRTAAAKRRWLEDDNVAFYNGLSRLWAGSETTRLGGLQWVMLGKHADHRELARSLVEILDAHLADQDDTVAREKDRLHALGVSTRGAVLTELLCHLLPTRYPILDDPVRRWRSQVGFDRGVGGSEGARYVRLAEAMRAALNDPGPRALGLETLAELDTLIWFRFKDA
ncbi:phospholipase D family protein [Ideonella sp.]|uniref:phospholipase D family protein n=1 Tax=Ideonella sp. TaxID=1929293 RepID=UPI0035ADDC7B